MFCMFNVQPFLFYSPCSTIARVLTQVPPASVVARLRAENALDAELHAFALALSTRMLVGLEEDLRREHGLGLGGVQVTGGARARLLVCLPALSLVEGLNSA